MTTHYSLSLNPAKLARAAKYGAEQLEAVLKPNEVPVLIYRGMSGVAAATAISLVLASKRVECGMIYVRKPEECSHSDNECERALPALCVSQVMVMVFVDDFCDSGGTRMKSVAAAKEVASFSDEMITLSLGNAGGLSSGIWRHTVNEAETRWGVGCVQ